MSGWRLPLVTQPTRGYYYFSSAGAPHYPGLHPYGSRNWVTAERVLTPPSVGEIDGPRPYYKGKPPPQPPPAVLVGSANCISNGDGVDPLSVVRTLPYGVDSRCYSGTPPPDVTPPQDMVVWLDAVTLPSTPSSAPVAIWPDLGLLGNPAIQTDPSLQPTVVTGGGPPTLLLTPSATIGWPNGVALGSSFTIFLTGVLVGDVFHPFTNGVGVAPFPGAVPLLSSGRNQTVVTWPGFSGTLPQVAGPGQTYLVWAVVTPQSVTISQWGGQTLVYGLASPAPPRALGGLVWHRDLPIGPNNVGALDLLAYDRALSPAEVSAVSAFLAQLHGL